MLDVLELFEEATDLVQGDKMVTISFILPAIRGLREDMSAYNNSYIGMLVSGLLNSSHMTTLQSAHQIHHAATYLATCLFQC